VFSCHQLQYTRTQWSVCDFGRRDHVGAFNKPASSDLSSNILSIQGSIRRYRSEHTLSSSHDDHTFCEHRFSVECNSDVTWRRASHGPSTSCSKRAPLLSGITRIRCLPQHRTKSQQTTLPVAQHFLCRMSAAQSMMRRRKH
jgi:hypothetical protein